jgi:DNA-binding beta-propeller fold protein YncE
MSRDASDVTLRNDYRTRYINYFVRKYDRITSHAIVNIVGGSGAANEESERLKVLIGATEVSNEEMDSILGLGRNRPVSTASTIFYKPPIRPIGVLGTPLGILMIDGSNTLYNLTTGTSARLPSRITALAISPSGKIYVASSDHIYQYIAPGTFIDMNVTGLVNISALAVSADETFYVLEDGSSEIFRAKRNSAATVVAGSCMGYADGPGATALFNNPKGIALDPTDQYLYIADTFNSMIRQMVTTAPYMVTTLAGNTTLFNPTFPFINPFPTDNVGNRDGTGLHGENLLYEPHGITVSPSGVIYVADTNNHDIRSLVDGTLTTIAGVPGSEPIYDVSPPGFFDAPAAQSRWFYPIAISYYDSTLYIAEPLNFAVRSLTIV